jgi:hypothetical protein
MATEVKISDITKVAKFILERKMAPQELKEEKKM